MATKGGAGSNQIGGDPNLQGAGSCSEWVSLHQINGKWRQIKKKKKKKKKKKAKNQLLLTNSNFD